MGKIPNLGEVSQISEFLGTPGAISGHKQGTIKHMSHGERGVGVCDPRI